MRKTKEIKRKRREAGAQYNKGARKEAYEMWASAKKELDELRGRNKPAEQKPAEQPAAPAAS
jgi:hypothetical protein